MTTNTDAILSLSLLVRLETLVKPNINRDIMLMADNKFFGAEQYWLPIGDAEFNQAIALRACHKIKTPGNTPFGDNHAARLYRILDE